MRKNILATILMLLLASCTKSSGISGIWTVKKVSFDFNERKSTPEMIRQLGEMEKNDTLLLKDDGTAHIVMAATQGDFYYVIDNGTIFYDTDSTMASPMKLGTFSHDLITATTQTVIGKMKIEFEKK